ncbi:hypothetical protein DIPPA_18755 [Diplonema papillatum]|nr:hypothetical protein DIPPA_18755 [Diplonema papillatum]
MSRRAKDICSGDRKWDHRVVWWKDAWADVKRIAAVVLQNSPVSVILPTAATTEEVWADASGAGGGYVLPDYGVVKSWAWTERQLVYPIHLKEAWALEGAVRHWLCLRSDEKGVEMKTDSALVWHALRKLKATGWLFNESIRATADLLEGVRWTVDWVPSKQNIADAPSRKF